jgi:hypothetical protein
MNMLCRKLLVSSALIVVLFIGIAFVGEANAVDAPGVHWPDASKRASISSPFLDSTIVIGLSSRTAGAVDSLVWRKHEFVNRNDHGREFQAASSFDGKGECLNPTEAGSADDGPGPNSTSRLLSLDIFANHFVTRSLMAYWIRAGGRSNNCHGLLSTVPSPVSHDSLTKVVTIGVLGVPNAIEYRATFGVEDHHQRAGFEAITGYMPPEFHRFWTFDPGANISTQQAQSQGAQSLPLLVSTENGEFALGVVTPIIPPARGDYQHVYGRWDFSSKSMASPTIKWNSYFLISNIDPHSFTFTSYIFVGSLDDVRSGMTTLCARVKPLKCVEGGLPK